MVATVMQDAGMFSGLGTAVSGALVGALVAGATLAAVELWLKPRRQRRNTAVVLATEVLHNAKVLFVYEAIQEKSPFRIPDDFHMSEVGFQAVADHISALPTAVVEGTLEVYSAFRGLNETLPRYREMSKLHSELGADDARRRGFESYLNGTVAGFKNAARTTTGLTETLIPKLRKLGKVHDAVDLEEVRRANRARTHEHQDEVSGQKAALQELRERSRKSGPSGA